MESTIARLRKVSEAKKELKKIVNTTSQHFLVHYSCESFIQNPGRSHRVTSIAIRNLENAQTESFSIFQYAEKLHIGQEEIQYRYDEIEKEMLNAYFDFLQRHSKYRFIHWNMRDVNYGFQAIEHRGSVLHCKIFKLPDEQKIDLARILDKRFSGKYADNPKIPSLITLNNLNNEQLLTGKQEADAFNAGEFVKLHQSTLRKVNFFEHVISLIEDGNLKTKSSFKDVYGLSGESITKAITDHWIYGFLSILALGITLYQLL